MGIQLGSAYGKVEIDASGVKKGVDTAISSLENMQLKMAIIGQTMTDIGKKMTLGLTLPLALFAKSAVNSSNQSEEALANLRATLESTNRVAGITEEKALEMAAAFQKTTKFSDETVLNGESMLLTFTKIGKDVFPMAVEAMLNMGAKFGSVDNAAIQLGKALQDPIQGVTALRRVGVKLSETQEAQIKHFMAVNDIASAQKIILQELQTEFGGLAIEMGKTDSGKIDKLINAFDDLKELFGDRLKKSLIPFVESITKAINDFLALPEPVKNAIVDMVLTIGKIAFVAGPIIFIIGKMLTFASLFLPGGALAGVGTFITTTLLPALGTLFSFITGTAIPAIAAFAVANSWWIVPLLIVVSTVYLVYLAFKNNFMGITTTAKQFWFLLKFYFIQGWQILLQVSQQRALQLQTWFKNMITRITQIFKSLNWSEIGKYVILGITNGLLMGIPAMVAAAVKGAKAVMQAFDRVFDSHSPSEEMKKRGIWAGQGFIGGWEKTMQPNTVAQQMAKPILNTSNINQTKYSIQLGYGLTLRDVDRLMDQKLNGFTRQLNNALGGA